VPARSRSTSRTAPHSLSSVQMAITAQTRHQALCGLMGRYFVRPKPSMVAIRGNKRRLGIGQGNTRQGVNWGARGGPGFTISQGNGFPVGPRARSGRSDSGWGQGTNHPTVAAETGLSDRNFAKGKRKIPLAVIRGMVEISSQSTRFPGFRDFTGRRRMLGRKYLQGRQCGVPRPRRRDSSRRATHTSTTRPPPDGNLSSQTTRKG